VNSILATIQTLNDLRFARAKSPIRSESPIQAIAIGGIAIEIANIPQSSFRLSPEYRDVYSVELPNADRMFKTLKRVVR
jgi:hypothetical protein